MLAVRRPSTRRHKRSRSNDLLPGPGIEGDYFDCDNEELLIRKLNTLRFCAMEHHLVVPPLLPQYRTRSESTFDDDPESLLNDLNDVAILPFEGGARDGISNSSANNNTGNNSNNKNGNNHGYDDDRNGEHPGQREGGGHYHQRAKENSNRGRSKKSSGGMYNNKREQEERGRQEEEKEEIEAMEITEVMKVIRDDSERLKKLKFRSISKSKKSEPHQDQFITQQNNVAVATAVATPATHQVSTESSPGKLAINKLQLQSSPSSSSMRPRTSPPGSSSSPLSVYQFEDDTNIDYHNNEIAHAEDPNSTTTATFLSAENHTIFIKKINSVSTSTVTMSLGSDDQEKISGESPTNQTTATSKTVKRGSLTKDSPYVVPAPFPDPQQGQGAEEEKEDKKTIQRIRTYHDDHDDMIPIVTDDTLAARTAASSSSQLHNYGSVAKTANPNLPLKSRLQDVLKQKGDAVALKQKKQSEHVTFPWGRLKDKPSHPGDAPTSVAATASSTLRKDVLKLLSSRISSPPPQSLPLPFLHSPPLLRRKQQQHQEQHQEEEGEETQQDVVILNPPQPSQKLPSQPQPQPQPQPQQEYKTFLIRRTSSFSSSIHDMDENEEGTDQQDEGIEFKLPLHETFQLKRSSSFSSSIHDLDDDDHNHDHHNNFNQYVEVDFDHNHDCDDDAYLDTVLRHEKDDDGEEEHDDNRNKEIVDLYEIDMHDNMSLGQIQREHSDIKIKKPTSPRHHEGRRRLEQRDNNKQLKQSGAVTTSKSKSRSKNNKTKTGKKYDVMYKQEMFIQLQNDNDLQDFKRINNFTFEGDYLLSKILRERSRIQMKKDMLQQEDVDFYINIQKNSKPDSTHEERKVLFFC